MRQRWLDSKWQAQAHQWIDTELDRLTMTRVGPVEQPHVEIWSTVMRVPTDRGTVWFKANIDALRYEVVVVEHLSKLAPELIPPLLAAAPASGWMLMSDAGERLREVVAEERSLERWTAVLPRYAELQIAAHSQVARLVALGVPDMRLASLPRKYEELISEVEVEPRFHAATSHVVDLCDRLAGFGIAETVQHDDLHDGQVFVRHGVELVMDWGDGCISHPFFTLSVALEGVISWGLDDVQNSVDLTPFRDAYLEPFVQHYRGRLSRADLNAAADVALRLGWVCRAVNGHVPGEDAQTRTRLRMFLDGQP